MAYQVVYRFQAKNFEGTDIIIHVSDTTSGLGTPVFTDLTLISCESKVESPEQSKHAIIKTTALTFTFLSTSSTTLANFASGEDNRFLVEAYIDSTSNLYYTGYLVTDATRQAFLQVYGTYGVELTATDGLAQLKEVTLVKDDGTNPRGYYKPIQYISWALAKTNLSLPINIADGICEENATNPATAGNWYNHTYVWAKTFEKEINVSIDCYGALETLLQGRVLFQAFGEWYIIRTDEIDNTTHSVFRYSASGAFVIINNPSPVKNIGLSHPIKFIESAEVFPERRYSYAQLTLNYDFPIEIVDNIDFARGTTSTATTVGMGFYIKSYANVFAFPTVGEFDLTYKALDTGNHYKYTASGYTLLTAPEIPVGTAYTWEDWTDKKGNPDSPSSTTSTTYIAKIRQYGIEKARYGVLTSPTVASVLRSYKESNPIYIHRGDKFVTSVDYRFPSNITNGGATYYVIMAVRLKGEDGSRWWLGRNVDGGGNPTSVRWLNAGSSWMNAYTFLPGPAQQIYFNGTYDLTEWQSVSWDAPPCPVSGDLYIELNAMNSQSNTGSTWDDVDIHYTNLQFEYIPMINGTYTKYDGHHHKVSKSGNLKANLQRDAGVGDYPKKLFKRGLFKLIGSSYIPTERFYNYNATTAGELTIAAFSKYQAFEFWNQHYKEFRIVEGQLLGLNSDTQPTNLPGLYHTYLMDYTDYHTTDKYYMILSYRMDLLSCRWDAVFAEAFDSTDPKVWTDTYEFKHKQSDD
jgi:hypothetical protein